MSNHIKVCLVSPGACTLTDVRGRAPQARAGDLPYLLAIQILKVMGVRVGTKALEVLGASRRKSIVRQEFRIVVRTGVSLWSLWSTSGFPPPPFFNSPGSWFRDFESEKIPRVGVVRFCQMSDDIGELNFVSHSLLTR